MKFIVQYTCAVPLFADFVLEADNEEHARMLAEASLEAGIFDCIDCETGNDIFGQRVTVEPCPDAEQREKSNDLPPPMPTKSAPVA